MYRTIDIYGGLAHNTYNVEVDGRSHYNGQTDNYWTTGQPASQSVSLAENSVLMVVYECSFMPISSTRKLSFLT